MPTERSVDIRVDGDLVMGADLVVPETDQGVVVFAHGSGSSRHSPRNRAVAGHLQRNGLATLLLDLLSPHEEEVDARTGHLRFDVDLLAGRLTTAARWARAEPDLAGRRIGYFGASTGGAAALLAAAEAPEDVGAVVSRGGRPDLAGPHLRQVRCPTLLIVGGADDVVLELNRQALDQIGAEKSLVVVPGATHLFPEPGALDSVADHAARWFTAHL